MFLYEKTSRINYCEDDIVLGYIFMKFRLYFEKYVSG